MLDCHRHATDGIETLVLIRPCKCQRQLVEGRWKHVNDNRRENAMPRQQRKGDISIQVIVFLAALRTPISFFSTECFPLTGPKYPILTVKKSYLIPDFYQMGI